jgi:hypothetical protein
MTNQNRKQFRESCLERDNGICVVPWCREEAVDVHHIIERELWADGGYIENNGASVCSRHHKHAEETYIPPQAFWFWIGIDDPIVPEGHSRNIDKWGEELESPPWKEHREYIKYPSTRHLPFSNIGDKDDTYHRSVDPFLDMPLVITHKMDGSNAMIIKDTENPVRARNGKKADHQSFSLLKDLYWDCNVHENIPENIQVFGEWLYAKHSIHYGCDCENECEDVGPSISSVVEGDFGRQAYFQVFGAYNMDYDMWLSWPSTQKIADELGFPTVPVVSISENDEPTYEKRNVFYDDVYQKAESIVQNGEEGLVVRSKYPFHYGEFGRRLGKYVRENHVKTDEHWKFKKEIPNRL